MSLEVIHSIILIITVALSFLFARSPLAEYDLQFAAVLFILLYITKRWYIPSHPNSHLLESVIFTFIVVTVIMTTGAVTSPFFFLLYFLLFSLALFLEPIISLTISISLIIFLLLSLPEDQGLKTLVPVFSLAFLTPFALFMGEQYLKNSKLKTQKSKLESDIANKDEDRFLFNALVIKTHVKNIRNAAENFMGDKELQEIRHQAARLEELIDRESKG